MRPLQARLQAWQCAHDIIKQSLTPSHRLGVCGPRSVPNVGVQGWQIIIDQVTADTAALTADTCLNNATQPCITFLDTGNPGVALPTALYTQVARLTGALMNRFNDFHTLPNCSTVGLPTFAFHIGGRAFDLAPADYVFTVRARASRHTHLITAELSFTPRIAIRHSCIPCCMCMNRKHLPCVHVATTLVPCPAVRNKPDAHMRDNILRQPER